MSPGVATLNVASPVLAGGMLLGLGGVLFVPVPA